MVGCNSPFNPNIIHLTAAVPIICKCLVWVESISLKAFNDNLEVAASCLNMINLEECEELSKTNIQISQLVNSNTCETQINNPWAAKKAFLKANSKQAIWTTWCNLINNRQHRSSPSHSSHNHDQNSGLKHNINKGHRWKKSCNSSNSRSCSKIPSRIKVGLPRIRHLLSSKREERILNWSFKVLKIQHICLEAAPSNLKIKLRKTICYSSPSKSQLQSSKTKRRFSKSSRCSNPQSHPRIQPRKVPRRWLQKRAQARRRTPRRSQTQKPKKNMKLNRLKEQHSSNTNWTSSNYNNKWRLQPMLLLWFNHLSQ